MRPMLGIQLDASTRGGAWRGRSPAAAGDEQRDSGKCKSGSLYPHGWLLLQVSDFAFQGMGAVVDAHRACG